VLRWILGLAILLLAAPAAAHKPSDSYLALRLEGSMVPVQWDIALRDLEYAIGIDADEDGAITWQELGARHNAIAAYALARLQISADGQGCSAGPVQHQVNRHSDGAYAVLSFVAACPGTTGTPEARYSLFFDLDPLHRGLARLESHGQHRSLIFSPGAPIHRLAVAERSLLRQFVEFAREGVWHIWIGFDHLLFLLSLLLPAVLARQAGRWVPVPEFKQAFWKTFSVVTAFTLAHSLTLTLAALEVVTLPARWVEPAIAASVVVAALNNVYPVLERRLWIVAFLFGLIHGFGFASVLRDLGLAQANLLLALVSFNLGVEAGQLAIVTALMPIAFALRRSWFYQRLTLSAGSLLIVALACVWLVERVRSELLAGAF
jgi:HupE / UreJ protein